MKSELESVRRQFGLQVPLKVDLGIGRNWRTAHP
jgi:DNA polymerase-1